MEFSSLNWYHNFLVHIVINLFLINFCVIILLNHLIDMENDTCTTYTRVYTISHKQWGINPIVHLHVAFPNRYFIL